MNREEAKIQRDFAINSGWRIHFNVEWYRAKERAAKVLAGSFIFKVQDKASSFVDKFDIITNNLCMICSFIMRPISQLIGFFFFGLGYN